MLTRPINNQSKNRRHYHVSVLIDLTYGNILAIWAIANTIGTLLQGNVPGWYKRGGMTKSTWINLVRMYYIGHFCVMFAGVLKLMISMGVLTMKIQMILMIIEIFYFKWWGQALWTSLQLYQTTQIFLHMQK